MKLKAIKVRIYPNATQQQQLVKTFGCCRFIYNQMLAERKAVYDRLKDSKRELYEYDYKTEKEYKSEFEFLKEVDSIALQQSRMDLSQAYQNFFRRCKDPKVPANEKGFPKFKAKHRKNSFRVVNVNNNIRVDFEKRKIKAPKLGWISFRDPRKELDIRLRSVTFSMTPAGKFYASMLIEDKTQMKPQVDLKKRDLKIKGLDMSLTDFFVDDEGNSPQYDAFYRNAERKIAELDRKIVGTKLKGLKNKLYRRRARLHERIANKRKDFIEKLSRRLVNENDVIVIEDLSLKDMAKFRKWEDRRGSKDKGNHGKSVSDLGWGYFTLRLKAKAEQEGKVVIEADRWFASTQTCSKCGYRNRDLTTSVREWTCPQCGTEHRRDQNAAQNLKAFGLDKIFTAGTAGRAGLGRNGSHLQ